MVKQIAQKPLLGGVGVGSVTVRIASIERLKQIAQKPLLGGIGVGSATVQYTSIWRRNALQPVTYDYERRPVVRMSELGFGEHAQLGLAQGLGFRHAGAGEFLVKDAHQLCRCIVAHKPKGSEGAAGSGWSA